MATFKDLVPPVRVTTGTDLLYQAPGPAMILAATVTNTSAGAVTITIYMVPEDQAVDGTSTIYAAKSIPVGTDPVILDGLLSKCLAEGGSIRAIAGTADALTIHISGVEF